MKLIRIQFEIFYKNITNYNQYIIIIIYNYINNSQIQK